MNKGLKNAKRAYNINHPWEKCGFCGGQGLVNLPDYYGNIQYDWYGNPIRINCPNCGGYGWVRR